MKIVKKPSAKTDVIIPKAAGCVQKKVCRQDLDTLRASGLTDETIRENELYTEPDPAKVAAILKHGHGEAYTQGGLVFPYRDLKGSGDGYARVRPHTPRTRNGKPVKYEQPADAPCRAYFPKASLDLLRDGAAPFITVGEKKALALAQTGKAAVGIGGAWGWKQKGTDELIDDLAAIGWRGQTVYIVFDHDMTPETRQNAELALKRLARALRKAGAKEVRAVELPPGSTEAKRGVDDFLVAEGPNAFHKLVERAKPVPVLNRVHPLTRQEGRTDANNASRLAREFEEVIGWVGPWDKWLIWDGSRWKQDQYLDIEVKAKEIAAALFEEIADLLKEKTND
jgi:hypothetical protein